jgi:hypothetical protein
VPYEAFAHVVLRKKPAETGIHPGEPRPGPAPPGAKPMSPEVAAVMYGEPAQPGARKLLCST